ncbi:MAG: DUF6468 domain-containing protein [Pseudomonadota bacterium]
MVGLISDLLLLLAALGAGAYCLVLSKRLTRLSSIDKGLGGAIAVLSAQVDDMTKVLAEARGASDTSAKRLSALMKDAENLANDLEIMLAACHDLPEQAATSAQASSQQDNSSDATVEHLAPEGISSTSPVVDTSELSKDSEATFGSRRSREQSNEAIFRRRSTLQEAAE